MFAAPLLIFQLAIFTPLGFVVMILRKSDDCGFPGLGLLVAADDGGGRACHDRRSAAAGLTRT